MDFKHKTYHRNILEKKLQKYSPFLVGDILDIGSGNRRYDHLFKGSVTAVDLHPHPELNIKFGDIEKGLDFPDESFDSILCLEVFEYLENHQKVIVEIHRLLKPGGDAIITIPFMYHEHRDKMRFTKDFMTTQFNQFSSIQLETIGNAYTVIWDILRKKWFLKNKGLKNKLLWFFILKPFLTLIRRQKIESIQDDYYSGLFIMLKK
jgi:SAM-dependent methyltransferase